MPVINMPGVLEVLAGTGTGMRGAGQAVGKEILMCRKRQAVCDGVFVRGLWRECL